MGSLVLELQQDALNTSASMLALLRKALVVATKLNIQELQKWTELELKGYSELANMPPYRLVAGRIEGFNPYHGWQPVLFPDANDSDIAKAISIMPFGDPISEIEEVLRAADESLNLRLRLDMELEWKLLQALGRCSQLSLAVSKATVYGIVEATRNIILEWSLKLEQDGILGEGISFSQEEKKIAARQDYSSLIQINIEQSQMQSSSSESQSNSGSFNNDLRGSSIANFANQITDNARQQAKQYNYSLEPQHTLVEAAAEVQRLLQQLEETNPAATEPEQVAYVNIAVKPDLKQRAIAALKEGGETAIEEFFLENKYLKVGKAVIKGWLQLNE